MDASRADASDPSPAATVIGSDPFEQVGAVIGPYKLIEQIGKGGFGLVFVAEQQKPVWRRVAIKVIKPGMDTHDVIARFEAERQALALMDHPNIARVFDAGTTDSGRPYFVMEFVRGVAITEFCDQNHLTPRERLELFVTVCQAVQHAHQKGIIHRDLKPSNVLVTVHDGKPLAKVIDFGVAKALHQQLTDKTIYTRVAQMIGTPLYMSPEQAQLTGVDIDTRSDIYSLGVLLYELLTGTTPFDRKRLAEAAYDEVIRIIRDEEPPKPSTRLSQSVESLPAIAAQRKTEPAQLSRMFRGDLDWITMKAMEKDRSRRYETANGLARDIERYLADEVVEARPPNAGYRLRKFVRRNKGQVAAAGAVLVALAGGLVAVMAVQSASLNRETRTNAALATANAELTRSRAAVQARYDLAVDAIKTFHTGDSEELLLREERFKDLRDRRLKSAADFYAKLSGLLGNETGIASRRALAQSNFELAELTRKVGRIQDALAAHQAVLAMREAMAAEPGADPGAKADVGRSMTEVAALLEATGKTDEALATYRRSESLLADLESSDPEARGALAACRTRMGLLMHFDGQYAGALTALKLARAAQEPAAATPGASNDARRGLAETVTEIGFVLWNIGKPAEAEIEFRTALGLYSKLFNENNAVSEFQRGLGVNHFYLGEALWDEGKSVQGEAEVRTALTFNESAVKANPSVNRNKRSLAVIRMLLGDLLAATGRPAAAENEYRTSLAILKELENVGDTELLSIMASDRSKLGILLLQMGKPQDAEVECRIAETISQQQVDKNRSKNVYHWRHVEALNNLGDVLRSSGRAAEAAPLYERAIALVEPHVQRAENPYHYLDLIRSTRRRAMALRGLDDSATTAAEVRRALRLCDTLPPLRVFQYETACCHGELANLAGRPGAKVSAAEAEIEATAAIKWLRQAIAMGYRNVNEFRIESAFDSLRGREDFKKLMAELEPKSPANPR